MPDIPRIVTIPAVLDRLDAIAREARAVADGEQAATVQQLAAHVAELAQMLALLWLSYGNVRPDDH